MNKNIQEEPARKAGSSSTKRKRSAWDVIRIIIIVVALGVFIFAAYNLITIYLEYKKIDDINANVQEQIIDNTATEVAINDETVELPFTYNYESLKAINPDALGFIYIPGPDIKLPIVQGTDNDKYLHTAVTGEYSSGGTVFEDADITGGLSASHVILYGHMMKNGSMFHPLRYYEDPNYYAQEGFDTIFIYTENSVKEFRIFSVHTTDPISPVYTINFPTIEQLQEYAESMENQKQYDTGVKVSNATQILTLSTCYPSDTISLRLIIQAILVGESPL